MAKLPMAGAKMEYVIPAEPYRRMEHQCSDGAGQVDVAGLGVFKLHPHAQHRAELRPY